MDVGDIIFKTIFGIVSIKTTSFQVILHLFWEIIEYVLRNA